MLIKIRKLQFLCGICLLGQIFFAMWILPFHLAAAILSIVIICWKRTFSVLQIQYHFYVLGLYMYRLWLFTVPTPYFLTVIYLVLCLYIAIMIILFSFRAIL